MKVLIVSSRAANAFPDVLYAGLRQAGATVLDFPYKPLYHCEKQEGKLRVFDEKGKEIGREQDDGMIHFHENYYGNTKILKWLASVGRGEDATDRDHEIRLDDFDMIVVNSIGDEIIGLAKTIMRGAGERAVTLDGDDDPFFRYTLPMSSLYLKRELVVRDKLKVYAKWGLGIPRYARYWSRKLDWSATAKSILNPNFRMARVASMCFTINDHEFDRTKLERDYDISLVASMTNPIRTIFARQLLKFARQNRLRVRVSITSPSFYGNIPWNEYIRIIRRSKITVSLPGASYDTIRHWEIPFYGSVLAAQRVPIEIRSNFEDMKSAILFGSFDEFAGKALEMLGSGAWADMLQRGQNHFRAHHTSLKRAETLLRLAETSLQ